jgi:hypothetical protein
VSDDQLRAAVSTAMFAARYGVDPTASDFHSQVLDKARIEFERTPNPMLPWSAIIWARQGGLDIPGWVIDHLYDKAVVLTKIVDEDVGEEEAREVGRALGFGAEGKGKTTAGAKLRQHPRDFEIAVHIADLMRQDLMRQGVAKENAAITETAKALSVSPATAYRAHKDYSGEAARFVATFVKSPFHESEIK